MRQVGLGLVAGAASPKAAASALETAAPKRHKEKDVSHARAHLQVLVLTVAREGDGDLVRELSAVEGFTADGPMHARSIDPLRLKASAADVVALDARLARPSAVYRTIVRLRGMGWGGGIVLMVDPEGLAMVPVASAVGTTDFVLSTAAPRELATRLRRAASVPARQPTPETEAPAEIELHWRTHHVSFGGTRIAVTLREMQLLDVLMARRGEVVTARDVSRLAWGISTGRGGGLTATFVCSLRKKLAWFGGRFGIQTVRGVGYRFVH